MKIKEIEIRSLFGYFDHKISLKEDDRITIIHGPNGVGKTTVLRLIYDLFEQRFHSLLSTPFHRIVVHFKPKGSLTVIRTEEEGRQNSAKLELIYLTKKGPSKHTVPSLRAQRRHKRYSPNLLERLIDNIERISPSEWSDDTGEIMSFDEVVSRYAPFLPSDIRESIIPIPEEIESLLKKIHIVFVETQRLFTKQKEKDKEEERSPWRIMSEIPAQQMTVEQYSKDMVSRIAKCQRESGEVGASLDSTFPQRLLKLQLPETVTEEHIWEEYIRQLEYRDRLMRSGLIADETIDTFSPEDLEANELKVLWIYFDDVKKKLKVFDPLLRKVELFKDIVNSHFSYKKFKVDREKGFIFETDHDGSIVLPKALSSGEQHKIVLTYGLLFEAQAESLIFIDEPELSLHVIWKMKFLEDIAKISELADLDFLIATHSPSIINDRSDLMVNLTGKKEN